jgi:hypothetical protein
VSGGVVAASDGFLMFGWMFAQTFASLPAHPVYLQVLFALLLVV